MRVTAITRTSVATFDGTSLQLSEPLGLEPNTSVRITVDALKAEETGSPSGLVDFVMKRMRPGAIVLMHNGPLVTVQAVPKLVPALRAHGYQIVTLHQLMGN